MALLRSRPGVVVVGLLRCCGASAARDFSDSSGSGFGTEGVALLVLGVVSFFLLLLLLLRWWWCSGCGGGGCHQLRPMM